MFLSVSFHSSSLFFSHTSFPFSLLYVSAVHVFTPNWLFPSLPSRLFTFLKLIYSFLSLLIRVSTPPFLLLTLLPLLTVSHVCYSSSAPLFRVYKPTLLPPYPFPISHLNTSFATSFAPSSTFFTLPSVSSSSSCSFLQSFILLFSHLPCSTLHTSHQSRPSPTLLVYLFPSISSSPGFFFPPLLPSWFPNSPPAIAPFSPPPPLVPFFPPLFLWLPSSLPHPLFATVLPPVPLP